MLQGSDSVEVLGVVLVGATPETVNKLLLTLALVAAALVIGWLGRILTARLGSLFGSDRFRFWSRQAISIMIGFALVVVLISIWFDDPARLATAAGLVTAGLAFALQRVITAIAGYFVILRGKTFNVGDRIVMGGVRGDVIALTFMQTKIMEMGQPPPVTSDEPAIWVHSRQFTGRIVTVSNEKIFDEPVYNYTYHFPYVWEELRLPIRYPDDRDLVESILLEAAQRHAISAETISEHDIAELNSRYNISTGDISPRVYWRLTDNWLELAVRFLSPDHGTRNIKDAMSREIIAKLDEARIGLASATYEITGLPKLELTKNSSSEPDPKLS